MRPEDLHVAILTRVIAPLHGIGGLEQHGRDLLRQLLNRGVHVTLITQPPFQRDEAAGLSHAGLTIEYVPYRTFPGAGRSGTTVLDRSSAYPWFGWRAGRLAARLVAKGGIHVVHGMGAAVLGYAAARQSDRYETVPLILNPHGMEEFGSTGHGLGSAKRLLYAPLRRAVRRCARAADRVIATDRVLVPVVLSHLRVPQEKVAVIPNAVDLDAIDRASDAGAARLLREKVGLSQDDLLLVGVGRLEANKGFHVLVDAVAKLAHSETTPRRWRVVLLGDGSERQRLERAAAAAGLGDALLMPGRVGDAELHAWYEAATLFVHPSLYEGSSIVTLEAMAHGLPVVATTAGGLPDKVRPGVNGWLVAPGDASALADALAEAVAGADQLAAMGAQSRAIVEGAFSWRAATETLLRVYDSMLTTPIEAA